MLSNRWLFSIEVASEPLDNNYIARKSLCSNGKIAFPPSQS